MRKARYKAQVTIDDSDMIPLMKLSTSQAAKLLNIHPDTLRKRAKAGKVPYTLNVLGHMQFEQKDLKPPAVVPPQPQTFNITRVIFVIDESVSMSSWTRDMDKALKAQVQTLRDGSSAMNAFLASDLRFGTGTRPMAVSRPIDYYNPEPVRASDGSTSLYDGIGAALEYVRDDMRYGMAAYLVVVITDGQENSSKKYSSYALNDLIRKVTSSDRVTIAINCPPGHERSFTELGIPSQNIRPWEQSTQGVQQFTAANVGSTQAYTQLRVTGQTVSANYYANLGANQDATAAKLSVLLDDVTKGVDAQRVTSTGAVPTVKSFAEKNLGGFQKGSIFYELSKKEKVQSYKKIIVQDQKTGKFYQGWDSARQLLGLPAFQNGEIKVSPGKLGDFKVFVQSTSVNRKLVPGTTVVKLT